MPSKTSKPRRFRRSLWKSAQNCAENESAGVARELAAMLNPGDRVLLEGELGAGKTTFARALLLALGVVQPPEGSPSFAIAHEYGCARGTVVHVDFYRLKSEAEIEDAGINVYYWERDDIVISEWTSMFPTFEEAVMNDLSRKSWIVTLDFAGEDRRNIRVETITPSS